MLKELSLLSNLNKDARTLVDIRLAAINAVKAYFIERISKHDIDIDDKDVEELAIDIVDEICFMFDTKKSN